MLKKMSFVFPWSVLLFTRVCYGQFSSPFPSASYPPGPGPRTIGNSTYTILCEQVNPNELAPYVPSHIATAIKDIDACMALCDNFGDTCEIALWDPAQANPCTLLTAVPPAQAPPAPTGRCYAAKIRGTLPSPVSFPVSFTPGPASFLSNGLIPTSSFLSFPSIPADNLSLPLVSSSASSESTSTSTSESQVATSTSTDSVASSSSSENVTSTSSSTEEETSTSSSSIEGTSISTTTTSSTPTTENSTSTTSSTQPERTNALCGPAWPDISIRDCPQTDQTWGRCCSRFGFCGNETAYCGYGCLTGFGSCDTPAEDSPVQPSSSAVPTAAQSSTAAQPIASLPFPVWSAAPFYESYYWLPIPQPAAVFPSWAIATPPLPIIPTPAAQPTSQFIQSSIGIVSSPFFIAHSVPFSSPNFFSFPLPSAISITPSRRPSPMLPNPPVVDPSTGVPSSGILLQTSFAQTPSPVTPNPPVIEASTGALNSDLILPVESAQNPSLATPSLSIIEASSIVADSPDLSDVTSTAIESIQPASIDTPFAALSAPTDSSISASLSEFEEAPLVSSTPAPFSAGAGSFQSLLPGTSSASPIPVGPNPPVVEHSPISSPYASGSATVSFVA